MKVRPYSNSREFLFDMYKHGAFLTADGEEHITPTSVRDTCITFSTLDGNGKMTYKEMMEMYFWSDDNSVCGIVTDEYEDNEYGFNM